MIAEPINILVLQYTDTVYSLDQIQSKLETQIDVNNPKQYHSYQINQIILNT